MDISKDIIIRYMDGKLSEKENFAVQTWIADHPEDHMMLSCLDEYYAAYKGERTYEKIAEDSLKSLETHLGIGMVRKSKYRLQIVGLCIALLLLPFLTYKFSMAYAGKHQPEWVEINVPYGQTRQVTLDDGTSMLLNAGSKLMYPEAFSAVKREIFLDGEALINVAKDTDHPFIIRSGSSQIKVTGTKFNFKSFQHDNAVEIALLEGSVEYTWDNADDSKNVNLKAGDLMRYDKREAQVNISTFNVDKYESLAGGRPLRFINEPLFDIVSVLERTFDKKIVIADKELAQTQFLALFLNNESLDEILSALNSFGRMSITEKGGVVIIDKSQY